MDEEGLWSVEFISSPQSQGQMWSGVGAGVVVLETWKLFGGDSTYFYLGTYSFNAGKLTAIVDVKHYYGPRNAIFGDLEQFRLNLRQVDRQPTADPNGNRLLWVEGELEQNQTRKIAALLTF